MVSVRSKEKRIYVLRIYHADVFEWVNVVKFTTVLLRNSANQKSGQLAQ